MNLLCDAIVQIRTVEGARLCSFPELLAALVTEEVIDFPALRPHQTHAAYALFAQLGAAARRGTAGPLPRTPAEWQEALLAMSEGETHAWDLVGEDLSKPAFLQAPVPEGSLKDFGGRATPDSLDLLVTAKNHDLKSNRATDATPEEWLWALVSLQTMDGYPGRGYYGVFRMNGGFGNRCAVAFVPGRSLSLRFRKDVRAMIKAHVEVASRFSFDAAGKRLLWLDPWDGTTSYRLSELDPWCVEICRRVRLTQTGGKIRAATKSTASPRCDGGPRKGAVGDPWLPIALGASGEAQALTISEGGFGYRKVVDLLDPGKWSSLFLHNPPPTTRHLYMATLVRGQGKTDGWHERWIDMDERSVALLDDPTERQLLVDRARQRVAQTALVQQKCLYPAVSALLAAGGDHKSDDRAGKWTRRMDAQVDAMFFADLWSSIGRSEAEAEAAWLARLREIGKAELEAAIAEASVPTERRYRAIAAAERIFFGSFHNHFMKERAA